MSNPQYNENGWLVWENLSWSPTQLIEMMETCKTHRTQLTKQANRIHELETGIRALLKVVWFGEGPTPALTGDERAFRQAGAFAEKMKAEMPDWFPAQ